MDKELEKIRKRSTEILGDYPEKRAELLSEYEEAEANKKQAKAALDAATDLDSYDKARAVLKRAELAAKFAKGAVDRLDGAPRMTEAEYMQALTTCRGVMNKATSYYKQKAAALMAQLKAVRDEYIQTAEDTNGTLVKLDDAANVLQTKYPYKVTHYQGVPDRLTPNRDAWREYALRYDSSTACTLATVRTAEERAAEPHNPFDSVLVAAWQAVERGYPRRGF